MPETKAQRSAAARKGAATRKRHAAEAAEPPQASGVERTAELSEEVLKSLEAGQRAAIEAVTKFVDTVDQTLPALGGVRPGGRRSSTPPWRWPTGWSTRVRLHSQGREERRDDA